MSETPVPESQTIRLTPERPWPGLASYTQSDKSFFFGREAESVELHRLVRAEPLAVLFGTSGLGKTSLLEAGLFPRLLDMDWLPIPVRLHFAHGAPPLATQMLKAAERSAGNEGLAIPQWHEGDTLWQAFHRRGQLFWGEAPDPVTPVVVLDQFEECFTLGEADPTMRQHTNNFLVELSDLVNNRAPWSQGAGPADADAFTVEPVPLRVVLGLREDYLAALESLRTLFPGLRRARLRLLPFTAAQARQVVERPGAFLLGPGAVDAILDTFLPAGADPTDTAADPALLSLFCWQLNEQRLAAGLDRLEAEHIAGSRERILRKFYTGAFAGVENAVAVQRWVEESLVDAGGYRSSRSWDDALAAPNVTRPALDLLIKRRLLHPIHRPGAPTHLELTHDRLREVVVEKREARRTAEANAAVEARAVAAAAAATELQRRLWRARVAAAVMTVLFALAVGLVFYVFFQREIARTAASQANVSLARYSTEAGDDAQALAHLAQALRLNERNYGAAAFIGAIVAQTGWPLPVAGQMRHDSVIVSVEFSPDGRRVLTASVDKTARLWDAATGKPIGEPMKHEDAVLFAQFSSDGQRVVTASWDSTARLWDAATGKPIGEPMKHEGAVHSAQFSSDGQRVVTASSDGTTRLWDAATGKPIGEPMRHEGSVNLALFSPDGQRVVTGSLDGIARLWDATTGKPIGEPMKHEGPVGYVQFSPDGQRVVTASEDKTARLWDAATGKPIGEPMRHEGSLNLALFSPDSQRVVTVSEDKTARLWDAATGKPTGEPMKHEGPVGCAQFSPDGQRVVTGSLDRTARLWDAATGKPIGEPMKHASLVDDVGFSRDGQRVVTASADGTARLWNAATAKPISEQMKHEDKLISAQFSPDGQRVVTASWDKTARLWDVTTGERIGEPMKHGNWVFSAQFSSDGQRVVTASFDDTARLWDAATGKAIGEPMRHEGPVLSAQFSSDGRRVVTASADKTARLWDAVTGKPIGEPMKHEDKLMLAQFSPDGQRVVTGSFDGTVRLWDAATGKPIGEPMKHGKWVNSAQFSRDGRRVLTASSDKTARLWDAVTGKPIGEPMKHEGAVLSAQFSRDGRRVLTASGDNTARLWDAASGKAIGEPMRHEGPVFSAQFSPDSQRVVTASSDGTARLWDVATGEQMGESMKHGNVVYSAQFSPDGQRVVTASFDHTARLWDVPTITSKDTAKDFLLLADLAEATGGIALRTSGQIEILSFLTPEQARATSVKIGARYAGPSSKLTPLERLMKWSVSERRSRTISPFSQLTVAEWIENRITKGTLDGLRAAIDVDPANPRLAANFGRHLADQALEKGTDPDEARRDRGEADFQTRRALKLAPDNDEVKKLRAEVVKLLQLNQS